MTLAEFKNSLSNTTPPSGLSKALQALWYDAKGDWVTAHAIAQSMDNTAGAWVHAYLHRKEGDIPNASYWYRRVRRPLPEDAADAEWERIVTELL